MSEQWKLQSLPLQSRNQFQLRLSDSVEVPFTALIGESHTPTALVIAGVHGDEYEGPAAIHSLMEEIDPEHLHGSVLFVPIANPEAFAATTRRHPIDDGDLNRSFPGDAAGTATQQLAHLLVSELVLHSSCILSLHGWSKESLVLSYAEYPGDNSEAAHTSREAAIAAGFQYLYPYDWPTGVLGNTAMQHGIPIVEAEVGGLGTITAQGQKLYREAILRFLAYFRILDYHAKPSSVVHTIGHIGLYANYAGLFRSCVEIGDRVRRDQQLGVIRDLDGRLAEAVRSPGDGLVGVMRALASVQPGDLLYHVFLEKDIA